MQDIFARARLKVKAKLVCKIPLLARALCQAPAMTGYFVYIC